MPGAWERESVWPVGRVSSVMPCCGDGCCCCCWGGGGCGADAWLRFRLGGAGAELILLGGGPTFGFDLAFGLLGGARG